MANCNVSVRTGFQISVTETKLGIIWCPLCFHTELQYKWDKKNCATCATMLFIVKLPNCNIIRHFLFKLEKLKLKKHLIAAICVFTLNDATNETVAAGMIV